MATLISNTGIQFIEWTAKIDYDTLRGVKLNYRSLLTPSSQNDSTFKWVYDDLEKIDGKEKQVVDENGAVSPDSDEFFQDQWYRSAFIHSCNQMDPYANKQMGIPIFPVFGKKKGGNSLEMSFFMKNKKTTPVIAKQIRAITE